MSDSDSRSDHDQLQAARLLARGARILGLSAVAWSRGQRSSRGPWYVLGPHSVAAAEEILQVFEENIEPNLLEAVVKAAMDHRPATVAPSWCAPLERDPELLDILGRELRDPLPSDIFGRQNRSPSHRERGMAALALALCRSLDGLRSLALKLPDSDADRLLRMGHLAQVTVGPGEPTRIRSLVKQVLKREASHG